jgi:hypothetical protein
MASNEPLAGASIAGYIEYLYDSGLVILNSAGESYASGTYFNL